MTFYNKLKDMIHKAFPCDACTSCERSESYKLSAIEYKRRNIILSEDIQALRDELDLLQSRIEANSLPDIDDRQAWYKHLNPSTVRYSAPRSKHVIEYCKQEDSEDIIQIADELLSKLPSKYRVDDVPQLWNDWAVDNVQRQTRGPEKNYAYVKDIGEVWQKARVTAKIKKGDCDDYMLLGYSVLRIMFQRIGMWEDVKHRLWCVVGNVNKRGLPFNAGSHAYLRWFAEDKKPYTLETTYYSNLARSNWLRKNEIENPMYGSDIFMFNEEVSVAHDDIKIDYRIDYSKQE